MQKKPRDSKKVKGKACRQGCFDTHFWRVRSSPQPPPDWKRSFNSNIWLLRLGKIETNEKPFKWKRFRRLYLHTLNQGAGQCHAASCKSSLSASPSSRNSPAKILGNNHTCLLHQVIICQVTLKFSFCQVTFPDASLANRSLTSSSIVSFWDSSATDCLTCTEGPHEA